MSLPKLFQNASANLGLTQFAREQYEKRNKGIASTRELNLIEIGRNFKKLQKMQEKCAKKLTMSMLKTISVKEKGIIKSFTPSLSQNELISVASHL